MQDLRLSKVLLCRVAEQLNQRLEDSQWYQRGRKYCEAYERSQRVKQLQEAINLKGLPLTHGGVAELRDLLEANAKVAVAKGAD